MVAGTASPAVLRQLGVLRRRPTRADRVPERLLLLGGTTVLRDSVRVARALDGTRFVLYVSRGFSANGGPRDPVACAEAIHAATLDATAGEVAVVRDRVRRIADGRLVRVRSIANGGAETLSVLELQPGGGLAGGGDTLIRDGRIPAIGSVTLERVDGRRRFVLTGVVPDGVAFVRVLDRDGPSGRRAAAVTVRVDENVYRVVLPRRMGPRMIVEWRRPDQSVVRRVHPRF